MKLLLSFFILLFISSCSPRQKAETHYVIKYGHNEVNTAEFINKMMTLGFVKYGKTFYSKIYDQTFFEQMRSETLEHSLNSIFMNELSKKFELKITNKDVQDWIANRAPDYSKEDLILTLQANNLTFKDWTNLFREQLVQHRISQKLMLKAEAEIQKETSNDRKKITHYKIAVLTYENQLDADQAYKQIGNSKDKFDKTLKSLQSSNTYTWLTEKQIPFYSKIKKLRKERVSKPFETDWGFLLVRIAKKEKRAEELRDAANSQVSAEFKSLVADFRKNPKLQINADLLYSLKIKK